jgi:hypothetical protein
MPIYNTGLIRQISFLVSLLFTYYFSAYKRHFLIPYQMLSFWLLILEIFFVVFVDSFVEHRFFFR